MPISRAILTSQRGDAVEDADVERWGRDDPAIDVTDIEGGSLGDVAVGICKQCVVKTIEVSRAKLIWLYCRGGGGCRFEVGREGSSGSCRISSRDPVRVYHFGCGRNLQFIAFFETFGARKFQRLNDDRVLRRGRQAVQAKADLAFAAADDEAAVGFGIRVFFAKSVFKALWVLSISRYRSSVLAQGHVTQLGGSLEPFKVLSRPKNFRRRPNDLVKAVAIEITTVKNRDFSAPAEEMIWPFT